MQDNIVYIFKVILLSRSNSEWEIDVNKCYQ